MSYETVEVDLTEQCMLALIRTVVNDFSGASQGVFESATSDNIEEAKDLLFKTVLNEAIVRALTAKLESGGWA